MIPPTFESSREENTFTVRLLLHHFLNEKDLVWLQRFKDFDLSALPQGLSALPQNLRALPQEQQDVLENYLQ